MAFTKENIWFFSGTGSYIHWNGIDWQSAYISQRVGGIQAAWGVSSSDFYIVGDNGSISHYDGNSFTLMESNTDIDLFEIKGYVDSETGEKHIWALGSEDGTAVVMEYKNGQWTNIWDMDLLDNNYVFPQAIYIPDNKSIVMSVWSGQDERNARLYCFSQQDMTNYKLIAEHDTYVFGMAGVRVEDLFVTGSFNQTEHFNGQDFHNYKEILGDGRFYDVDVSNNNIYIVGRVNQQPLFMHGER